MRRLIQWVVTRCHLCGGWAPDVLCVNCKREFIERRRRCLRCAIALPEHGPDCCVPCLQNTGVIVATEVLADFCEPSAALLDKAKFANQPALARWLGKKLGERLNPCESPIDWLCPIPLSKERLALRGYNQAFEIAKGIGHQTGLPAIVNRLQRRGGAKVQSLASNRKQRKASVRGVFVCTQDLTGQRVALVDDVITSGATVEAAAKTLHQAGAESVYALAVWRTPEFI